MSYQNALFMVLGWQLATLARLVVDLVVSYTDERKRRSRTAEQTESP